MIDRLKDPIFFIGFPRSGTTIIFEAFVRAAVVGWLTNYAEMWPRAIFANLLCPLLDNRFIHLRGHKKQYGKALPGNRYLPQPVEAYSFWDTYSGENFSRDYLLGKVADQAACRNVREALQKTLFFQRKARFATKLTGPGRIRYLMSIFPDAQLIHVIRDGRAAVESLLRVQFWREKGGMDAPFWLNGLESGSIEDWKNSGNNAVVLAAHQWKRIIETTRDEARDFADGQYVEVKYEDFIASPETSINSLYEWTGLGTDAATTSLTTDQARLSDMNRKYREIFSDQTIAIMNRIMGPLLDGLGYPA